MGGVALHPTQCQHISQELHYAQLNRWSCTQYTSKGCTRANTMPIHWSGLHCAQLNGWNCTPPNTLVGVAQRPQVHGQRCTPHPTTPTRVLVGVHPVGDTLRPGLEMHSDQHHLTGESNFDQHHLTGRATPTNCNGRSAHPIQHPGRSYTPPKCTGRGASHPEPWLEMHYT